METNGVFLQVGNKCDKEAERMVSREEGQKCARKYQMMFIEVSSGEKRILAFLELYRLTINHISYT